MGNSRGRIITIIVIFIFIALTVISLIPFNTVPGQTMETYFETETRQEPYTTRESYTVRESVDRQRILYDDNPYSVPFGINVPVIIDKPGAALTGHFELPGSGAIRICLPSNRILYEQLGKRGDFSFSLSPGEYTVILRDSMVWGERVYLSLTLKWTEEAETTKYREITKNRDGSVQVEKQRPVTVYIKASWWEMIFGTKHSSPE